MIRTLRTYRTLPALLATLMVLSVGLPVLCQVCAPATSAAAESMDMHAAHETGHDAPAHCLHGHGEAPAKPDADAPHSATECDHAACTMMTEEPAPAVQTERVVLSVHDAPMLIARALTLPEAALSSPVHVPSDGQADHHLHIPVRLRTASFLL
jgi:hypothetical protein